MGIGFGASELAIIAIIFMGFGSYGAPLGCPPAPADPVVMQAAPDDFLFYSTWRGVGEIQPEASATDRWIAQKEIQASVKKFKSAAINFVEKSNSSDVFASPFYSQILEAAFKQPGCIYVTKLEVLDKGPKVEAAGLLKLGDAAQGIQTKMEEFLKPLVEKDKDLTIVTLPEGKFYQVINGGDQSVRFGIKDDYLVIGVGEGSLQRILKDMETPAPKWVGRVEEELSVERVSSISRLNLTKVAKEAKSLMEEPGLQEFSESLGLDDVSMIDWVAGHDPTGYVTRTRLTCPEKPIGVLSVLDGDAIPKTYFKEIPDDKMFSVGMRMSTSKLVDLMSETAEQLDGEEAFEEVLSEVDGWLGIDFRQSMEESLDDYAYFYGDLNLLNPAGGAIASIRIKNPMSFEETYNQVISSLKEKVGPEGEFEFKEKESNGRIVYSVTAGEGFGANTVAWSMGEDYLYFSAEPRALTKHLRSTRSKSNLANDDRIKEIYAHAKRLDVEGPVMVSSVDIGKILSLVLPMAGGFLGNDQQLHEDFPFTFADFPGLEVITNGLIPDVAGVYRTDEGFEVYQRQIMPGASLGMTGGMAMAIAMPAVEVTRTAAKQTVAQNDMRQLSLSILNFEAVHQKFPASFTEDEEGKQLLSWRVHVLPFLEEGDLYKQFHLDEPWDSEHNKALIDKMPEIFAHPALDLEAGKTVYLGNGGPDGMFVKPNEADDIVGPLGFGEVRDGSSNTILIFEVKKELARTWTEPGDFDPSDFQNLKKALSGNWEGGKIQFARADGSVAVVPSEEVKDKILREMSTRDGGEVIDVDW